VRVVFRVDAYEEIALGHLARCISLAHAVKEQGADVHFLIFEDEESIRRLEKAGHSYDTRDYKLGDDLCADGDLVFFESVEKHDVIVIDSYSLDGGYFSRIKKHFSVVAYIDDLGRDYPVDIVVNSSCGANQLAYQASVTLLGMQYLILDKYYWSPQERRGRGEVGSIMITMGGVDHYNLSSALLPVIESLRGDLVVHIVIGPYYRNMDLIQKAAKQSGLTVCLHAGLDNISEIIERCDIAISAGGFTIYELASSSIPSVGIALWENQKLNIECLAAHEAILPVFYGESVLQEVALNLARLVANRALRASMVESGRVVIDGQGARRIARKLMEAI